MSVYLSVYPKLEDCVKLHVNEHVGWGRYQGQGEIENLYLKGEERKKKQNIKNC